MSILAHDFLQQQTSADVSVRGDLNDGLENPSSVAEAWTFSFHGLRVKLTVHGSLVDHKNRREQAGPLPRNGPILRVFVVEKGPSGICLENSR
jgi:hypothetical protein